MSGTPSLRGLAGEGWTLTRQAIAGETNGYTNLKARAVVVRDDIDDAQAVKTLNHEAAHVILHAELDPGEYVAHRGIWETEAESVAYVVAAWPAWTPAPTASATSRTGRPTTAGGLDTIRATAARVLAAVHTIAEVLDPTSDETANGGNDDAAA
ncbi:hypothetical protein [Nocardioides albidus]|uniref:hypothetical protein n=1 Tax=Nocardioides albidus TaxID=1517589 RepID=UPI001F00C32B|nr:hypothetical protein [Nocardioides albidus]